MGTAELRNTIFNKLTDSINKKSINKNNKKLLDLYTRLSLLYQLMLSAIDKVVILEKK